MISWIFSRITFKLWDVLREFSRHSYPCGIVEKRIIDKLKKYGRLKPAIKGRKGVGVTTLVGVPLVGVPWLAPGLPSRVPTPTLVPDMIVILVEKMQNQRMKWMNQHNQNYTDDSMDDWEGVL